MKVKVKGKDDKVEGCRQKLVTGKYYARVRVLAQPHLTWYGKVWKEKLP